MKSILALVAFLCAAMAQPSFGQMLEKDAPPCNAEAISAARDGAAHNIPSQIYLLARYYSTGKCFAGDGPTAISLYQRAATLNYPPAFYNLGIIAAAHQDYGTAEQMFTRGARLGNRGCELQLGIFYSFPVPGYGDDTKAYAWLSFTASRNEDVAGEAASTLKDIQGRIHPDLQKANALIAELKQKYGGIPPFKEPASDR